MQKKYYYKNIILFKSWGTWEADYMTEDGRRFALHRAGVYSKKLAYDIAKESVDYLNAERGNI